MSTGKSHHETPDRSRVLTEQRNPRSANLDQLDTAECVKLINAEDATIALAVQAAAPTLVRLIDDVVRRMRSGGRLIYIGAGTSGRLGVLDASECPPTFQTPPELVVGVIAGGDAALRKSSEGKEDDENGAIAELTALSLKSNDSLIGIAAGGTTPYVLGSLRFAKQLGALSGLLTCSPPPDDLQCDHVVFMQTGPEVVTGSTRMKAGTATKMALNIISTTLMVQLGKTYENLMVDVKASNAKLRDRAARIISTLCGLERPAAFELLDRAQGLVKHAVVMHRRGVSLEEAAARLTQSQGRLREALEGIDQAS